MRHVRVWASDVFRWLVKFLRSAKGRLGGDDHAAAKGRGDCRRRSGGLGDVRDSHRCEGKQFDRHEAVTLGVGPSCPVGCGTHM